MSKIFQYPSAPIYGPVASPRDLSGAGGSADYPYLGIYTKDATKRYTLGTRYIEWDGRVFKYAQAGATMKTDLLCWQHKWQAIVQWAQFPTTHPIGANPINITTSADDGIAFDGVFTEDELAGGYIVLFWGNSSTGGTYGMVGNDAVTAAGDMAVYLDHPNRYPITAATGSAEALFSPYYDVRNPAGGPTSGGNHPMLGVPMAPATTVYPYHWVQTWGPTHIATSDSSVGGGSDDWQVVAGNDGSVNNMDSDALQLMQHVGFALAVDYDGGTPAQASPFIMLQIGV